MVRKIYGRPSDDPVEDLDVNVVMWGVFMNAHSQSSSSPRKWPWREFETCKEFFLELHKTTFRGDGTVNQWSDRDYLYKPDWLWRFEVDIDKLVNTPMQRSMFFPTRCCVWGKWDTILLSPGRNKFSGILKPITSANWLELIENPWSSSGRSSQDSRQRASSVRFRKWWAKYSVFQRTSKAGSSSCQCSTTLYGMRKEMKNYVKIIQKEFKNTLEDFLAVIGLSLDLVQKRSDTPHTIANQTDVGIGLRRKWSKISKDLVTQYSVVLVSKGEDNHEAKKEEGQQYIPQHVMTMFSCAWKWSSPSISSVFTEQ